MRCLGAALLLIMLLMSTAFGADEKTLKDVTAKLRTPFHEGLYRHTYESLIQRVESDGYLPESVNGGYAGMFPRTVGNFVSLCVQTGDMEKARQVVDIVLRSAKANNLQRAPHIMDKPRILREPVEGSDFSVSTQRTIALYRLDAPYGGAQTFTAPKKPIRSAEAWISGGEGEGTIGCEIVEKIDSEPLSKTEYRIHKLSPVGNWIRFEFPKPVKLEVGKKYILRLRFEGKGTPCWWGIADVEDNPLAGGYGGDPKGWISNPSHLTAFALDTGGLRHKESQEYPLISRADQIDGTCHFLAGWAMVVLNSKVKKWENETYPQVAQMTDTACDWPYVAPQTAGMFPGLVRNMCLEHSREGRYWDSWDILTQAWACQALRYMTKVAQQRGDIEHARRWQNAYKSIEKAVDTSLTMQVDGKPVYAEMRLPDGGEGKLFSGLSWENLAPIAAQWEGANPEILKNTIDTYHLKAVVDWQGAKVMADEWDPSGRVAPQIIGKSIGWDMAYALKAKDYSRIYNWLDFLQSANKDQLFAETFNIMPDGKMALQDPGNADQCCWWCWGMAQVRKECGLSVKPE